MCERVRQKLGHTINLLSELSAHQLELILICPEKLNWPGRRGSVDFKKKSRPFFIIIFKLRNSNFKTRDFSPLIERVLAGVSEAILSLFPNFMQ